jgi:hypothetical protein
MKKSTLFIDESGKASLADSLQNRFILTGVILDNTEIQVVEGFFNYIKLKFKIVSKGGFHSYDVYENPKSKLSDSELTSLSKYIADFLSLIPIKIFITVVDKDEFRKALGAKSLDDFKGRSERKEMKDYPYRVTATYIFAKFGEYLINKDACGEIIADSRKGGDHQLLKTLDLCKEKAVPLVDEFYKAIKNNITAICFAEKGFLSGGLEITDIISYTSFNKAIRKLSTMSNTGLDKIWGQISAEGKFNKIDGDAVRRYFKIKKGEVHKYLK